MTDRAALLAAIRANRDDDTARLAFADWLEDRCDPPEPERAEFIRVQVELSHLLVDGKCPRCKDYGGPCNTCEFTPIETLRRRERELFVSAGGWNLVGWNDVPKFVHIGLPQSGNNAPYGLIMRGFVSALTCSWADWLAHADAILREQPVERVKYTTDPELETVIDGPFSRIRVPGKKVWYPYVTEPGRDLDLHNREVREWVEKVVLPDTWKGIAFELPADRPVYATPRDRDDPGPVWVNPGVTPI